MPTGYAETHTIVRNESNTVTVDQAGTGSAGTFTVTVDASSFSSDTAFGGAVGIPAITATGSGTGQTTAHLVMTGTYAGGAFTVTSETYSETGSYSVIQSTVTTYPNDGDAQTTRVDTTRSGNHTLGWSAAVGTDGQLAYTSYDFVSTEAAHSYTRHDLGGGALYETTTDAAFTVHTVGSGSYATYTGTDSTSTTVHTRYPNPGGTPFEYTSTWGWNNPVSGMAYLGGLYESTANWTWNAGTATATNYTFHGVAVQNDALTETATLRAEGFGGSAIDVHSFTSTSHLSDSGHVIDDEPGTPASGTELYHRDELGSSVADVTGSGSYIAGYANADYHATEIGTFAVANAYTVNDDTSTGTDEDGQAYSLTFNYTNASVGSGTVTNTHDYHDGLLGLTLTGETIGVVAGSTATSRSWGTRNGVAFDTPNVNVESVNHSLTIPGNAGDVGNADGLENAFPMRGTTLPKDWMFCQVGPVAGAILGRGPQQWYNYHGGNVEADAKKKVGIMDLKIELFIALGNMPNGENPPGMGIIAVATGDVFADALGDVPELKKAARAFIAVKEGGERPNFRDVSWKSTTVELTYAFDGANQKVRSGNVAVNYVYIQHYTATNKAGVSVPLSNRSVLKAVTIHDGKFKEWPLK